MVELQTYLYIIHTKRSHETIEKEAKRPDVKITFVNVLIASLLALLLQLFSYDSRSTTSGFSFLDKIAAFNPVSSFPGIIITFIQSIILFYLSIAILHTIISRVLGGNGKFSNLAYVLSILQVTTAIISVPMFMIMRIPLLSCIIWLPYLIILIYFMYIQYKILRAVYSSLSREKAIGAFILYAIIIYAISFVYLLARASIGI